MNGKNGSTSNWNVSSIVRVIAASDPWVGLTLLSILTKDQWSALLAQEAVVQLRDQVRHQVRKVLQHYPPVALTWLEDITDEVMIKLAEGRFWKRYDANKRLPAAYIVGCAFQYARTIARSYWRGFGRDAA